MSNVVYLLFFGIFFMFIAIMADLIVRLFEEHKKSQEYRKKYYKAVDNGAKCQKEPRFLVEVRIYPSPEEDGTSKGDENGSK